MFLLRNSLKQTNISLSRGKQNFFMLKSTEHNIIMLINVKFPTIVAILTFISMIETTSESLKERKVSILVFVRN